MVIGYDRFDGRKQPQVTNCPFSEMGLHMGKKDCPTIAYQVTVDHTAKNVLEMTRGFPGRQEKK